MLHGLEKDRKRQRIRSRSLESYEERRNEESPFDSLVPGLSAPEGEEKGDSRIVR